MTPYISVYYYYYYTAQCTQDRSGRTNWPLHSPLWWASSPVCACCQKCPFLWGIVSLIKCRVLWAHVSLSVKCHLNYTHTHTHTRLTALFPGLPGWAGTRKVKPIWILLKQETVSGSGISRAICKSAPRSRQITMPAPHRLNYFSCFYRTCLRVQHVCASFGPHC